MERDNQILIGAVLILLISLVSFNVNSITGKNVLDQTNKVYLDVYEVNPDIKIIGNNVCVLSKDDNSGICRFSLHLDERKAYYIRSISPDNWLVNWLKISYFEGPVFKEVFCKSKNKCEFKLSTLRGSQEYMIETQVSKVLAEDFFGEKTYTIEAESEKVPTVVNTLSPLYVYAISANGWVKDIKRCPNNGLNNMKCSLTLSLDEFTKYAIRSDTTGSWEVKSLKLIKDGKVLKSDFCGSETCQFNFDTRDQ